ISASCPSRGWLKPFKVHWVQSVHWVQWVLFSGFSWVLVGSEPHEPIEQDLLNLLNLLNPMNPLNRNECRTRAGRNRPVPQRTQAGSRADRQRGGGASGRAGHDRRF